VRVRACVLVQQRCTCTLWSAVAAEALTPRTPLSIAVKLSRT